MNTILLPSGESDGPKSLPDPAVSCKMAGVGGVVGGGVVVGVDVPVGVAVGA